MSAAKIIGIAVKTATIRELAHERPASQFDLCTIRLLMVATYLLHLNAVGEGEGEGMGGAFLYFTKSAGNLVLNSPHVGILHNFIICYHSACDFCLL